MLRHITSEGKEICYLDFRMQSVSVEYESSCLSANRQYSKSPYIRTTVSRQAGKGSKTMGI